MKLTYSKELLQVMQIFDKVVHVPLKDCFEEQDVSYFVVPEGFMGKAIGKGGINVKKLSSKLNRKVKIVEFSSDIGRFIRNVVYPSKLDEVVLDNGVAILRSSSREMRGIIIGRNAKNLNTLKNVVRRYFTEITDIRVE